MQNTVQLSDLDARIQARDFYSNASIDTGSKVGGMGEGVKVRIDVIRQREDTFLRSGDL
jgi:hypothetical protein